MHCKTSTKPERSHSLAAEGTVTAAARGIPPPCDCLIHCCDDPRLADGRATQCHDAADRKRRASLVELLVWHELPDLPDSDITVMCELQGDDEPTWPGYWTGAQWLSIDGLPFAGTVTAWADMPKGRRK